MNKELMFSSASSEWETPKQFFAELNAKYSFTLDAAASELNAKCVKFYTKEQDCLKQNWSGETVWVNPVYGRGMGIWVKKFYEESSKPNTTVVALLPARVDVKWYWDYIHEKPGVKVTFIKGRLKFEQAGKKLNSAPFPSMVVEFKVHETLKESYPVIHDPSASTKTDMDYVNFFNYLFDEDFIKEYHEPPYKIVNRYKLKLYNGSKK